MSNNVLAANAPAMPTRRKIMVAAPAVAVATCVTPASTHAKPAPGSLTAVEAVENRLSYLREKVEGLESPLIEYENGSPLVTPEVLSFCEKESISLSWLLAGDGRDAVVKVALIMRELRRAVAAKKGNT